jgi:predicted nucleic acid-binding protein
LILLILHLIEMKPTEGRFFADSNILLYLLSNDDRKKTIAKEILNLIPVISTQVITENINVAFKKFTTLSTDQILLHKTALIKYSELVLIDEITINIALEIKFKYKYQWYDSLIIASAYKMIVRFCIQRICSISRLLKIA